jgi:hypothetical protein
LFPPPLTSAAKRLNYQPRGGLPGIVSSGQRAVLQNRQRLAGFPYIENVLVELESHLLRHAHPQATNRIVFDFKYDGPGPGKSGTGVGWQELARKTIPHTPRRRYENSATTATTYWRWRNPP